MISNPLRKIFKQKVLRSCFLFVLLPSGNTATLKVPAGSVETYKAHEIWGKFTNIIVAETKVSSITLSATSKAVKVGDTFTLMANA